MSQEEWDDPPLDNESDGLSPYQKGYVKGMVMMVVFELALFGLWKVLPL